MFTLKGDAFETHPRVCLQSVLAAGPVGKLAPKINKVKAGKKSSVGCSGDVIVQPNVHELLVAILDNPSRADEIMRPGDIAQLKASTPLTEQDVDYTKLTQLDKSYLSALQSMFLVEGIFPVDADEAAALKKTLREICVKLMTSPAKVGQKRSRAQPVITGKGEHWNVFFNVCLGGSECYRAM